MLRCKSHRDVFRAQTCVRTPNEKDKWDPSGLLVKDENETLGQFPFNTISSQIHSMGKVWRYVAMNDKNFSFYSDSTLEMNYKDGSKKYSHDKNDFCLDNVVDYRSNDGHSFKDMVNPKTVQP